jgi:hypothetical protein
MVCCCCCWLQGFLGSDWQEPSEFKGCGKFVSDSWRIFCKGAREAKGERHDRTRQHCEWQAFPLY